MIKIELMICKIFKQTIYYILYNNIYINNVYNNKIIYILEFCVFLDDIYTDIFLIEF